MNVAIGLMGFTALAVGGNGLRAEGFWLTRLENSKFQVQGSSLHLRCGAKGCQKVGISGILILRAAKL